MSAGRWVRVTGGVVVLGIVVERVGLGPFAAGLRAAGPLTLVVALAVTAVTTLCCAWRWRLVAHGLGVEVSLREAVTAYYRSQFLNATLPGGVLGDVHRAVRHGRQTGELRRSAVAVGAERAAGQVLQAAGAGAVLLLAPAPWASVALGVLLGAALLRWPQVVAASAVAAGGHVVVFLVAARAAGIDAPLVELLPLALVVLMAAAVPISVAGWGPREGAAAWVFSAAGLGAGQGATVAVLYGVLALVATLPGAVLLVAGIASRRAREPQAELTGVAHG